MSESAISATTHPMPFTRLELVVLSVVNGQLCVLLGRRTGAPHSKTWALPGGVLRIDMDATLLDAAQRVATERLGCTLPFLRQLCAVGGKKRDPTRAPWALSVVYRALLPQESFEPKAGKRLDELKWVPAHEAADDERLAFDHSELIAMAVQQTHAETEALALPQGFLPDMFTLGELQSICEILGGRRLDKSSFRRRLADQDLVEPVEGEMRGGQNRPAQLFRLLPM
jgi:8-oxo-dGTP diphosphatase